MAFTKKLLYFNIYLFEVKTLSSDLNFTAITNKKYIENVLFSYTKNELKYTNTALVMNILILFKTKKLIYL